VLRVEQPARQPTHHQIEAPEIVAVNRRCHVRGGVARASIQLEVQTQAMPHRVFMFDDQDSRRTTH